MRSPMLHPAEGMSHHTELHQLHFTMAFANKIQDKNVTFLIMHVFIL